MIDRSREWMLGFAKQKEIQRTWEGAYPPNWRDIADFIKTLARWQCERCGRAHERDGADGFVLTVHHLDGNKWNCELWNLAALCQRCHLRIQNKVIWSRIPKTYDWRALKWRAITEYPEWMAKHVKQYNVWAWLKGKERIPFTKALRKDYSSEWKQV